MEQYLIDTNVVSDYFSASLPPKAMLLMDNIIDNVPNLSIITQIELLCWQTDDTTEQNVKNFVDDSNTVEINNNVIIQCVNIRRNKKIKTPDAIIAATALANNYTLIINNDKDFKNINGIKIINSYNIYMRCFNFFKSKLNLIFINRVEF